MRERQVSRSVDADRHNARVALQRDARHRAVKAQPARVRLDIVGQIDGNSPLALQDAHQPPADEQVLGVESHGSRKLAPRFKPYRLGGLLVENMQRVVGKQ